MEGPRLQQRRVVRAATTPIRTKIKVVTQKPISMNFRRNSIGGDDDTGRRGLRKMRSEIGRIADRRDGGKKKRSRM